MEEVNIKQVLLCDLVSILFQKQYDLNDSLEHKLCFILSLMLRYQLRSVCATYDLSLAWK